MQVELYKVPVCYPTFNSQKLKLKDSMIIQIGIKHTVPVSLRLRMYPLGDINWDKNSTSCGKEKMKLHKYG